MMYKRERNNSFDGWCSNARGRCRSEFRGRFRKPLGVQLHLMDEESVPAGNGGACVRLRPRRVDAVYEINGQSAKGRRKVVGAQ